MNKNLTTVFFGSGPVAIESLRFLTQHFNIEAIVTKPATEKVMQATFPYIPVYAVSRKVELDELCLSQHFTSKFGILVDFGVIVGDLSIRSFPLGIINSHFSLLPQWRGVDPITYAILSGQRQTGVSLMLVVHAWDEGPLLAQERYNIPPAITTPELTKALIDISNRLLADVVPRYIHGQVRPSDQLTTTIGPKEPTYTRKLTKEDGRIDWTKPADILEREVRAYLGWPRSYTTLAGRDVIINAVRVVERSGAPGNIKVEGKHLVICCGKQALEVLELQPAGKPVMSAQAFLAGYRKLL